MYGLKCQLDEDECLLNPCNGGECVNKIGSYECHCQSGTTGKNCETLTSTSCSGVSCSNNGHCMNDNHQPVCNCNSGYSGTDCSVRDFCLNNGCKHGSTCLIGQSNYSCYCAKGYMGKYCEETDFCASSPCDNSGIPARTFVTKISVTTNC